MMKNVSTVFQTRARKLVEYHVPSAALSFIAVLFLPLSGRPSHTKIGKPIDAIINIENINLLEF